MGTLIDKLERKRTNKLIKKKIIGRVSDRKPDLASELVSIKSRRVSFKWLLGNKIGKYLIRVVLVLLFCAIQVFL